MDSKISEMFKSDSGREIYAKASAFIDSNSMRPYIERGVLIGLSGGADSVMLLSFLYEYRKREFHFPLVAVHVNHSIRGEEAERDEIFSREICKSLNVEFVSCKVDVPRLAKDSGLGIEECARNVRYSVFSEILSSRNDIYSIAVAHNSGDNLETVLLNILRGAGSRGAAGIPPIRENIIRPLLGISKSEIVALLSEYKIAYVTDSTNLLNEYRRNFIRNEIVPRLSSISPNPEKAFSRLSTNLRCDDDYISSVADDFLSTRDTVRNTDLSLLHFAVFFRVISKMAGVSVSLEISQKIYSLLGSDNFSYSIGKDKRFVCNRGICCVKKGAMEFKDDYSFEISKGLNELVDYDADIIISDRPIDKSSLNVYKISIQASLSSVIIDGRLCVRPRQNGDSIFYGGMTHKLKKLFNDKKIPPEYRARIPILCDESGIVWVPGFGVRDDGTSKGELYVTLGIGKGEALSYNRMHIPSEFKL